MSINDLLEAAEFLEKVEKHVGAVVEEQKNDCKNGHVNGLKNDVQMKKSRSSPQNPLSPKRQNPYGNRAAHNELEKTRRAQLRARLECLKDMVPSNGESSRNTTLSLLTRARNYIKTLEQQDAALMTERCRLQEQQNLLCRHLQLLTGKATTGITTTGSSVASSPPSDCSSSSSQRKRSNSESSASTISATEDLDPETIAETDMDSVSPQSEKTNVQVVPCPDELQYSLNGFNGFNGIGNSFHSKLDGLIPALPLLHPRISLYPYFCGNNIVSNGGQTVNFSAAMPQVPNVSGIVAVPTPAGVTVLSARSLFQ